MFRRCLAAYALFASLCVLFGCGKTEAPTGTDPKALFDHHCAKCHAQAGEPGGPPKIGASKGPNLTKIGVDRDAEWLAAYIRDPKSKKGDPKLMPAFGGTLTDEQIKSLAEYFAAKK
ncbi:MAG: c-type cytochrome [Gemmata sp.]